MAFNDFTRGVPCYCSRRIINANWNSNYFISWFPKNNEIDELDSSGQENVRYIGWVESSVLGVALSANALTNGLGAGLLGLSPLAISLTSAFGSFITVWLGVMVGQKAANVQIGKFTLGQFGTLISGITILIVAFTQIF